MEPQKPLYIPIVKKATNLQAIMVGSEFKNTLK